jgi:branched-chain amino acid transport system permease protein
MGIILVALLVQRRGTARVAEVSGGFAAAAQVRPVPTTLRALTAVRAARWTGALVLAALVVGFPLVVSTGTALKGGAVLIFGTIGISVVLLTGWAGQVSLAQMTFVGIGAATTAWAIVDRGLDPLMALAAGTIAGAGVAVVVGLPALRLRGLYLAVVTLALALAASSALFDNAFVDWIPVGSFPRPDVAGAVALDSAARVYYLALVVLVIAAGAAHAVRRSRTGRVLIAVRDNERSAISYGISATRAKLTSFAISGGLAALAGGTLVIHQAGFRAESYGAEASLTVFVTAIIGGVGTVTGALIGALYLRGAQWFLRGDWQLLATSAGVLLVLMAMPEGLGGVVFRLRDAGLRWIARRTGTDAPGLLGAGEQPTDVDALTEAEA